MQVVPNKWKQPNSTGNTIQRHRYVKFVVLLINMRRLLAKKKFPLNLFVKKRDGALNEFVRNFRTRSGLLVLLKIFCAKLTRRTQCNMRQVADERGLWEHWEQNRMSSELLSWYEAKKATLGLAEVPEKLNIWREYVVALFGGLSNVTCSFEYFDARSRTCCLILIVRNALTAAKRYCVEDVCRMLARYGFLTRKVFTVQPPINTQNDHGQRCVKPKRLVICHCDKMLVWSFDYIVMFMNKNSRY